MLMTYQFVKALKSLSQEENTLPELLEKQCYPILLASPASGRLLLNRISIDREIKQFNQQLIPFLNKGELREYCFHHFLITYLVQKSSIYLLSILSLSRFGENMAELWSEKT